MGEISIKKRHIIRKSQVAELFSNLEEQIGASTELFRTDKVEKLETDSLFTFFIINRKPMLMEFGDWVFPTLRGSIENPFPERSIVVDSGAVPFMIKGADVMRPGVVDLTDDIRAGCPVMIKEERHKKPIAVAIALMDAAEMRILQKGKVARTVHYVGDLIWNLTV